MFGAFFYAANVFSWPKAASQKASTSVSFGESTVQVCRVVWPIACACFYSLTPTLPLLALFKNNLHSLVTIAETIAIMASGKESSGNISETK